MATQRTPVAKAKPKLVIPAPFPKYPLGSPSPIGPMIVGLTITSLPARAEEVSFFFGADGDAAGALPSCQSATSFSQQFFVSV